MIVNPHEMKIVTETVQDVAYLKHMGYYDDNQDIHLKVNVSRLWNTLTDEEGVQIELKWEHQNCASCGGKDDYIELEYVQSVSGPKQLTGSKALKNWERKKALEG